MALDGTIAASGQENQVQMDFYAYFYKITMLLKRITTNHLNNFYGRIGGFEESYYFNTARIT